MIISMVSAGREALEGAGVEGVIVDVVGRGSQDSVVILLGAFPTPGVGYRLPLLRGGQGTTLGSMLDVPRVIPG